LGMIKYELQRRQLLDLGLALIVSAWIHILGFTFLRYLPPLPSAIRTPPQVMEVEIDVSALETISEEELKKIAEPDRYKDPTKTSKDSISQDESSEDDTISLESKAPEYLSYMHQIKNRVRRHWVFPVEALKKNQSGRLVAVFTLRNDGKLLNVRLDSSSGYKLLDQAALKALREAGPYPGFPDHIKLKRLNIRAVFDYRFHYVDMK